MSSTPSQPPEPTPAAILSLDGLEEFLYRPDEAIAGLPGESAAASAPATGDEPLREYLAFLVSGEEYAVPIGLVREIVRDAVLTDVPRAPATVLGVMMVRGQVVPVFDLRQFLKLPAPSSVSAKSRTVIVDTGRGPFGLRVDAVRQVLRLKDSAVEATPAGVGVAAPEAFRGIARVQGRMVVILDIGQIFGVDEE